MDAIRRISALVLLLAFNAGAATYYIDYTSGSDANSGTSTNTPWQHCPQMQPFSGSYTRGTGDRFIFKGGVTWPHAALPLYITISGGSASSLAYWGADTNWFDGSSFTRPIFDAEGLVFSNWSGNRGNVFWFDGWRASSVWVDNIEIKNFVWNNPIPTSNSDGCGIYFGVNVTNKVASRLYIRDWVVATTASADFGGILAYVSTTGVASNNVIAGPTNISAAYITSTGPAPYSSGIGIENMATVRNNEISGVLQGIWGGSEISGNYVYDCYDGFASGAHGNGMWVMNSASVFNNKLRNVKGGVGAYLLPGWSGSYNTRMIVFNNIFDDTHQIDLSPQNSPVGSSNQIWFFNNVSAQDTYAIQVGTTKSGAAFGTLVIQNNLWITDSTTPVSILDAADLGSNYTNANNVRLGVSTAGSLGLASATWYAPTQEIAFIYDTGADLSSAHASAATDILGGTRPFDTAWDIGAYEYGALSTPPSITTHPVSATKNVGESVTFSVVATGSTPMAYQWRKDGVNIPGAALSSYTISSVSEASAGGYTCYVSNPYGNATSDIAILTVSSPAPSVTAPGKVVIRGQVSILGYVRLGAPRERVTVIVLDDQGSIIQVDGADLEVTW